MIDQYSNMQLTDLFDEMAGRNVSVVEPPRRQIGHTTYYPAKAYNTYTPSRSNVLAIYSR